MLKPKINNIFQHLRFIIMDMEKGSQSSLIGVKFKSLNNEITKLWECKLCLKEFKGRFQLKKEIQKYISEPKYLD